MGFARFIANWISASNNRHEYIYISNISKLPQNSYWQNFYRQWVISDKSWGVLLVCNTNKFLDISLLWPVGSKFQSCKLSKIDNICRLTKFSPFRKLALDSATLRV